MISGLSYLYNLSRWKIQLNSKWIDKRARKDKNAMFSKVDTWKIKTTLGGISINGELYYNCDNKSIFSKNLLKQARLKVKFLSEFKKMTHNTQKNNLPCYTIYNIWWNEVLELINSPNTFLYITTFFTSNQDVSDCPGKKGRDIK